MKTGLGIKTDIVRILVSVCTCMRPNMLKNALLSVNSLRMPENINVEVIVVDNDKNETAKSVVEELKDGFCCKIHYFAEPERGIANARNKVLEEAINLGASHILFFDDDEILDENCLIEHVNYYNKNTEAVIVSGPAISIFKEKYPSFITKHFVFKQRTTKKTGLVRENCATGNVFFPLSLAKDFGLRFSKEYVFMGGEDGDFFYKASKMGFTIVWNNDAFVYEIVPPERANIKYILQKCYYNGYAGAHSKFKNNNKKFIKIAYVLKSSIILALALLLLIPSLVFGLTSFYNVLGLCFRTKGKIDGTIKNTSYNFYGNIYGH